MSAEQIKIKLNNQQIIEDYVTIFKSRQASLIGRKEVLTGKAKFGIFGDGKELAQVALAHSFKKGDWRSGYYRDQTLMMALGIISIKQFFAQLYADPNSENDPSSAGRQMNSHFATRYIDKDGNWLEQTNMYNSSADMSPTGGQMARSVGLAYASKIYRESKNLDNSGPFSKKGNEVCFVTIGNASTSEGVFWESLNAAGVLQIPLVIVVWDDDYGISVPSRYQTTKESISTILSGFAPEKDQKGVEIYKAKGWDYVELVNTFASAADRARNFHEPSLVHVYQMTQPQGHSTSGSHERYKSEERLKYEDEMDCISKMKSWIVSNNICDEKTLEQYELNAIEDVKSQKNQAWIDYLAPIKNETQKAIEVLSLDSDTNADIIQSLLSAPTLNRKLIQSSLKQANLRQKFKISSNYSLEIFNYCEDYAKRFQKTYSGYLFSESSRSPLNNSGVKPTYYDSSETLDGRQIIQKFFDQKIAEDPRIFIIGEDVGKIGGVNSEFEGIQSRHGEIRCTDTGIREATILGQGIGAAMRGLRPIVDIQYLDYLLYCLQTLSDDLASLHYRSAGGQLAPVIVRTKGHRLEGIWHSGSPIQLILGGVRGVHLCVPRNMTQATGFYQTLLHGDDPAIVIEVLNGYRLKEKCPDNLGEFSLELGVPEVLRKGKDLTIVTYGACIKLAEEAAKILSNFDIDIEIIDVQTLLPFDRYNIIGTSLEKTNSVIFLDEDVPGGASGFMMQQALDTNKGFSYLDSTPIALSAKPHRPAYGTDGDYYSKPNIEDIIESAVTIMHEKNPKKFPDLKGNSF